MIPPVTLPADSKIRIPVDLKLKLEWTLDQSRRVFESDSGETFTPRGDLPKNTKIVYKVSTLGGADPSKLSKHERELQRYVQVILPPGESPADYVDRIRKWPCVEEAHIAPEISLPTQA